MVAQGAGAGKPAALSDLIDAHRALRQVLAGAQQSFLQQPAGGRFTGGLLKAAQKGARPHTGALGEGSDGMAGGKMLVQIVKQLTEAQALPAAGYRAQDLLRLTAVAMGRDDQAAGDDVGGFAAEIFTHQMQTKVDPRRTAGGSHQQSIAHVKDVLHHLDLRKTGLQRRGVAPVGCRLAAIEQPGGGENEHPGTDRNNPTSAGVGGSQRGAQRLGDRGVDAAPAGDHDRIRLGEKFRTAVGHQADAAGSAQRPFIDGGDGELVPVVAHFRARQAEDLHGYSKLKGAQAIVGEGDHLMT